jgi:hypothetical protein
VPVCRRPLREVALARKANQSAVRFVGWAKRSVPTIENTLGDRWWARRKCAFAHPTALQHKKRGAIWRRVSWLWLERNARSARRLRRHVALALHDDLVERAEIQLQLGLVRHQRLDAIEYRIDRAVAFGFLDSGLAFDVEIQGGVLRPTIALSYCTGNEVAAETSFEDTFYFVASSLMSLKVFANAA